MNLPSAAWPYPKLIAHRGAGLHAPENTLAAIRTGAAHGYTMMEYDVKLSQDGVAILLHDDDVSRTSNSTGCAADHTLAELSCMDFGAWHSPTFAGEPIATLCSIAAYTIANNIHSNIEIKPHTGTDTHTGHQVAMLASELWAHASLPPLLSSFSEPALAAAMEAAPHLPRALLLEHELPADWSDKAQRLGCSGLNLNNKYATEAVIRQILAAGLTVTVWTVNDSHRMHQLLDWGCHAVFTDEVQAISPDLYA